MGTIDKNALRSVALFPLPRMVLFPAAVFPLHIFEERYREMTRDALEGSHLLVMGNFLPGYEADYHGNPPVHPVCGLGKIIDSQRHPDGRYSLLMQGVARVVIEEELAAERPYRLVKASLYSDETPSADTGPLREELISVCELLCGRFGADGQTLLASLRETDSPGHSADLVAANLIATPEDRQRLLEIRDPAERLRHVRELVAKLVISMSQDADRLN